MWGTRFTNLKLLPTALFAVIALSILGGIGWLLFGNISSTSHIVSVSSSTLPDSERAQASGDADGANRPTISGQTPRAPKLPDLIATPGKGTGKPGDVPMVNLDGKLPSQPSDIPLIALSDPNVVQPHVSPVATPPETRQQPAKPVDLTPSSPSSLALNGLTSNIQDQMTEMADDPDLLDPAQKSRRFVMSMCRDKQGRIWLGCEPDSEDPHDGGAWCFDPSLKDKQWKQYTIADGLGDNSVYAIACDRKGRIWAGHLNHGISVFSGNKWQNYEVVAGLSKPDSLAGPVGERVFAIKVCPADGDVWMATNAGLARYSESKDTWSYVTRADDLPSDQASSIAFDPEGNIYVGTQCDGVAMADAKDDYKTWRQVKGPDEEPTTPTGDGIPSNLTNDVLVARDGTVYLATDAGIAWSKNHGQTWKFMRGFDWADKVRGLYGGAPKGWTETSGAILGEDYCTCLAEDPAGKFYVGHRQRGVESVDVLSGKTMPIGTVDYPRMILADDGLQIGTYGHGEVFLTSASHFATGTTATDLKLPAGAAPPTARELQAMSNQIKSVTGAQVSTNYVGEDWMTQGDWMGRYGRQAATLCSGGTGCDTNVYWGHAFWIEAALGPNHVKGDGLRYWIHWISTENPKSLYNPFAGTRRQAEWDDHGEAYSQSQSGPDICVTVTVPQGFHTVSAYFMNKDGHQGPNWNRDYVLELSQLVGNPPQASTEKTVRTRVHDFWGGVYKSFVATGPAQYRLRIIRNHSMNAICSGIFVDRIRGPEFASDKIPKPWMGEIMLKIPPFPDPKLINKRSGEVTAAFQLANSLEQQDISASQLNMRRAGLIVAYRTVELQGLDSALERWRCDAFLWTPADRASLRAFTADAWQSNLQRQAADKALMDSLNKRKTQLKPK